MGFKCNQIHFTYQGRSFSFFGGGEGVVVVVVVQARGAPVSGEQNQWDSKLGSKMNIIYEQFYFLPQNNLHCVLCTVLSGKLCFKYSYIQYFPS
jgi:hypothetical protein